jgi:hypothetical protein
MIGQYLSNTNESATVSISLKNLKLNKALVLELNRIRLGWGGPIYYTPSIPNCKSFQIVPHPISTKPSKPNRELEWIYPPKPNTRWTDPILKI